MRLLTIRVDTVECGGWDDGDLTLAQGTFARVQIRARCVDLKETTLDEIPVNGLLSEFMFLPE